MHVPGSLSESCETGCFTRLSVECETRDRLLRVLLETTAAHVRELRELAKCPGSVTLPAIERLKFAEEQSGKARAALNKHRAEHGCMDRLFRQRPQFGSSAPTIHTNLH